MGMALPHLVITILIIHITSYITQHICGNVFTYRFNVSSQPYLLCHLFQLQQMTFLTCCLCSTLAFHIFTPSLYSSSYFFQSFSNCSFIFLEWLLGHGGCQCVSGNSLLMLVFLLESEQL